MHNRKIGELYRKLTICTLFGLCPKTTEWEDRQREKEVAYGWVLKS